MKKTLLSILAVSVLTGCDSTTVSASGVIVSAAGTLVASFAAWNSFKTSKATLYLNLVLRWYQFLSQESAAARKLLEEVLDDDLINQIMDDKREKITLPCKETRQYLCIIFGEDKYNEIHTRCGVASKEAELRSSDVAKIRNLVFDYINHLESILAAWNSGAINRKIVEDDFSYIFLPGNEYCHIPKIRKAADIDIWPNIEKFQQAILHKTIPPKCRT